MVVELHPITATDLPEVAGFLHANLNTRVRVDAWTHAVEVPWDVCAPNHGFLLRSDGRVVGAHLAYYAERTIGGRTEKFCNLGAWCVLEDHRAEGLRLLRALLRQREYSFTDFSPSGNVVDLNRRLGFVDLDTTTAVMANFPLPRPPGHRRVIDDPAILAERLEGADLAIYRDHRDTAAAHHLLLVDGEETCYVVFRRDTRKRARTFASILYVGNPELFRRGAARVGSHLLLRHGIVATLMELRVVGDRPAASVLLPQARPKMFRSRTLTADQIDYLYSELTCLPW